MDIFETAKAHADADAPAPADTPRAAALTAFGFGLFVIGIFFLIRWATDSEWIAWGLSAAIYGAIAFGDCRLGWARHRNEYQQKLAELKGGIATRTHH